MFFASPNWFKNDQHRSTTLDWPSVIHFTVCRHAGPAWGTAVLHVSKMFLSCDLKVFPDVFECFSMFFNVFLFCISSRVGE